VKTGPAHDSLIRGSDPRRFNPGHFNPGDGVSIEASPLLFSTGAESCQANFAMPSCRNNSVHM